MTNFRKTAPKPTAEQLQRIEKLEQEAQAAIERREESWRRSDTDGFLSQWANGITADKNRKQIEVLKRGGYWPFPVLCDVNGNVIADREYRFANQFNGGIDRRWRLPNELADQVGRKWVPTGPRSRILKQLGLHEETRYFPAYATIGGSGKGLSGCASAHVIVERKSEEAA